MLPFAELYLGIGRLLTLGLGALRLLPTVAVLTSVCHCSERRVGCAVGIE